eukprot:CAMPEP_0182444172 /NCGR_PEP_ID=MMETSP1172-20130603/2709_1 /TAXON_ID=708627 /ORGANISM="Timspurckia oligopyrenoides, Strain CCMP3278" /LENGTH=462 /DNA_ID=CAMNT_0024639681 /DNA_START=61 /DNA_END=1449 /DNA_ORIENTATION=-
MDSNQPGSSSSLVERQHSSVVKALKSDLIASMKQLQAKLEVLEKISKLDRKKKLDILFGLWDRDNSGRLIFSEVAMGIAKVLDALNMELDTEELLEVASGIASSGMTKYASTRNQTKIILIEDESLVHVGAVEESELGLSRDSFESFIDALCGKLETSFEVIAELLVLTYVGQDMSEYLKDEVEYLALKMVESVAEEEILIEKRFRKTLESETMMKLFKAFDTDSDLQVNFKELALGLEKFRSESEDSFEESVDMALTALLVFDENSSRTLSYVQFARFLLTFCAAIGSSFEEIGAKLLEMELTPGSDGGELRSKKSAALNEIMREVANADRMIQTVYDARCEALFEMFDRDGSGDVDFKELALGLRLFNPSEGLEGAAMAASVMLLSFDEDDDQKLDRVEFANFLNNFCETLGADFDELADFLVVACLTADDSNDRDVAVLSEIQPSIVSKIKSAQKKIEK